MRRIFTKGFQWIDQKYGLFTKMVALFAGLIMLTVVGIILKEVVSRNIGMVSHWSNEMTLILVLWMFMVPLAFSQMSGGMIRITFFVDKLPSKLHPWLHLFSSLSAVIFGLLFIMASLSYFKLTTPGSYFMITHFPTVIQRGLIPVSASLLTIAAIICVGRDIPALRLRKPARGSSRTEKGEST